MIQNEQELEVTRQRITAFQDALLVLRRNQSPSNYAQIAKNFLTVRPNLEVNRRLR